MQNETHILSLKCRCHGYLQYSLSMMLTFSLEHIHILLKQIVAISFVRSFTQ